MGYKYGGRPASFETPFGLLRMRAGEERAVPYAALRRSLCLPWKFGATSRMKRSISSFTCWCGFMPTLK